MIFADISIVWRISDGQLMVQALETGDLCAGFNSRSTGDQKLCWVFNSQNDQMGHILLGIQ